MSGWQALAEEVARWRDAGRVAELWWRDDDAVDAGRALDRLLAVGRETGTPLALAVVPAQATAALADRLSEEPGVDVLQHGYAHANHAMAPEKKIELGLQRPAMLVLGELGTGWMALERLFGSRALAVMVPPWNRIAPILVPTLPEIGYRGLSTFGPRARVHPVRGLLQVNTHVDLVDWKGGRRFAGEETALSALVTALARARGGDGEPIGILSHHLAMDAGAWDFLRSLCERMTRLENIRVRSARELFAPEAGRQGGRG
ncbi:polysaccharide deacetylase family protein [uncultured Reyranella sp.]|uniref:polysaccharide deacetylase family protein n=1 Tax=uncultured Reyranella sp. TaxID=735512 RepID=UPI0025FC423F|nr:polysaccharide deacetylase family protein [uncultured Reyranella sp.]